MNERTPTTPEMSERRESRDRWSDERLFALFATLPRLAPRAGFVDRVVLALPRRSFFDATWVRVAVAAALLGVAVSAALLVPTVVAVVRLAGPATILGYWISAVGDLFAGVGESLVAWDRLASFGRALGLALSQPKALALLALNVLLSLAAFRGLVVLTPRRSTSHAALLS